MWEWMMLEVIEIHKVRNIPRPKDHRSSMNGSEKVGGCGPLDGLEVGYQGQGMVLRHGPEASAQKSIVEYLS